MQRRKTNLICLQTVDEAKLKTALRAAGEGASQEKLDVLINLAIDQEKFGLEEQYSRKVGHCFSHTISRISKFFYLFHLGECQI